MDHEKETPGTVRLESTPDLESRILSLGLVRGKTSDRGDDSLSSLVSSFSPLVVEPEVSVVGKEDLSFLDPSSPRHTVVSDVILLTVRRFGGSSILTLHPPPFLLSRDPPFLDPMKSRASELKEWTNFSLVKPDGVVTNPLNVPFNYTFKPSFVTCDPLRYRIDWSL